MAGEPIIAKKGVSKLLEKYRDWVKAGRVHFLQEDSQQSEVDDCIEKLLPIVRALERNKKQDEGQSWYNAHKAGTALWEALAKYALRDIEPTAKGNSTLYSFLSAATKLSGQVRESLFSQGHDKVLNLT